MRGKHHVLVQDKRIRYEFTIRRNITIIRGDSATGKTQLIELLSAYAQNGEESGIEIRCDKACVVLTRERWEQNLQQIRDSIVFVDEGNPFISSDDFARAISGSDNCYVLITREALPNLPYSVEEIYGIRTSDRYAGLKQVYHELYRIYEDSLQLDEGGVPEVITEDSNAGYDFFSDICGDRIRCISAGGKSGIAAILGNHTDDDVMIIADGAAFGSEMEKVVRLIRDGAHVLLYLPESFEWMILSSGVINDPEIRAILEAPEEYISGEEYLSWERYFAELLSVKSRDSYLKYNKRKLNPAYLRETEKKRIIAIIPDAVRNILGITG